MAVEPYELMPDNELIPNLFRTEYSKIVAVLCKLFGAAHIDLAEDITNDTFLLAMETWSVKGIPQNPVAWLYTVAKNKTKDHFKRDKIFTGKVSVNVARLTDTHEEITVDLSAQNIADSQLQMMFAICNPSIPPEAQIGLALRILCGFGIDEIAEAFLTNKENINKRLYRAKEKLRADGICITLPPEKEIDTRLENVLLTLYLLFNEGYYSATQNQKVRKELCLEAMRLIYMLVNNAVTNKPAVNALLALMCFHASRFEARTSASGESILYEDQDRGLWDDELVNRGYDYLIASSKGDVISKYHLEASIAYWHCTKIERPDKWENILQLYNKLLMIDYSPMLALNRTYALAQANGKPEAIIAAEKLQLTGNHLYYALLGNLYTGLDNARALAHYQTAIGLAKTVQDKAVMQKHIDALKGDI